MKPKQVIKKEDHIETGLVIKIVLASAYDRCYQEYAKLIVPGSIHEIVDRPTRMNRKNGDMGVWVQGTGGQKVFVRMFGWIPYIAPKPMQRTVYSFVRKKFPSMQRTK